MKINFEDLIKSQPQPILSVDNFNNIESKIIGNEYTKIRLLEAKSNDLNLKVWISENIDFVNKLYLENGILLFRGFISEIDKNDFAQVVNITSEGKALNYAEPSTPRTKVKDQVYTSTEYPKEQIISQHNEHSYSTFWPKKLFFYCEKPSFSGGSTPIADSRAVYKMIPNNIIQKFESKNGVSYIRNFNNEMDISWEDFFETPDRNKVKEYCDKKGIQFQWKEDNSLRTSQSCQAVLEIPETNEKVWFNQAHLFHYSNLGEEISNYLIEVYGKENLPRNSSFGDGTDIDLEDLRKIRDVYEKCMFKFDWQKGDLLMVNNILYSHGRDSYTGDRTVLVSMSEEDNIQNYKKTVENNNQVDFKKTSSDNVTRNKTADFFIKNAVVDDSPESLKYKLAVTCRLLNMLNLDEGSISGHVTVRVPGKENLFWVNPFGLLFEEVTPDNLLLVNENGDILEGEYPLNVAGFCIHSTIHQMRKDINCVVHTHSPWGTLFSSLKNCEILPIDQNSCMFYENHIVFDQFDGPVNSLESANNLAEALKDNNVAILSNHGTITCGKEIESAFMYSFSLERAMRLMCEMQTFNNGDKVKLISPEIARKTKEWISNPLGFKIEFDGLTRKAERFYSDLQNYISK